MDRLFTVFEYTLTSSKEVGGVVEKISDVAGKHLLVHVASYFHNTVLVHELVRELTRIFPGAQIVLLPNERDAPTEVVVYSCADAFLSQKTEGPAALGDLLLYRFYRENSDLQSQLKESRQQLVERFFIDSLTSLPNLYRLRHKLQECETCSFIVFNIDNFKLINDFYGFVVGDFILEKVVQTIAELVGKKQVYRMSGDEFAVLIEEEMDFYALKAYLDDLSERLKNLCYSYRETVIYVDITLASSTGGDRHDIFSKVGMALKYAKEMQLPFWIYEDRMHFEHEYESNLKIALKVRKAIENGGIVPYFQPIVCNKSGEVKKFECLSRLIDEEGSVLSPKMFIPIAKKIKVYNQVTKTIIDKSFEIFKENEYEFSINLSIEDIMSREIYTFIIDKLKTSSLGHRVVFELLESEAIEDYKKVSRFINEIKRYGAKIAIDDFGSGFSNFSYLVQIDVDYIKIDGSLIEHIDENKNARLITETIVDFAKKMGIKTIAEFVHSSTVLTKVKQLGIDYSQGYHIDEPMPQLPFINNHKLQSGHDKNIDDRR